MRAELASFHRSDGEIETVLAVGSFNVQPDTRICQHHPVVADVELFTPFENINVEGVEDAFDDIGQSAIYDSATRVGPAAHPACDLQGAVHTQIYLDLNRQGRPFRLAVAIWQEDARLVVATGRDVDPQDPRSWGELPPTLGGPRFEDVILPAAHEVSQRALQQAFQGGERAS